jgi:periplasmic protein TonB
MIKTASRPTFASLKRASLLTLALLALASAGPAARAADNENDRQRDGLQGPVRRVRTESAKLVYKGGQMTEGERVTLETATYDVKGAKIDTAYFLAAGATLTGKEVYKYDERGNIVEMTLFNSDGSVMSKEKYEYEFDAMGNWTKMVTSVALVENGQMKFEPTEVTRRFIAYFLEESVTKKLQPGQPQPAPAGPAANAPANVSAPASASAAPRNAAAPPPAPPAGKPAAATNNKPAAATNNKPAPSTQPAQSAASAQASQQKRPAPLPSASLVKTNSAAPAFVAPGAALGGNLSAAHVVSAGDDVPPPPKKAPVRPVSGGVLNGQAINLPKPDYPDTARRMRATGLVVVEVVVDVSGRVISAKATTGPALLREAAERAAMQARFTPALLSGQPVKVSGTINYNFSL